MTEQGVDALLVKNIANKKVLLGLMENASPIIMSEMWGNFLSAQVCKNVLVPRILYSDEEDMFIR